MASFTPDVVNPSRDLSGSRVGGSSTAGAIGGALSGLADILDVGLKASAEDKKDKAIEGLGKALYPEVQDFAGQSKIPDLLGESTDPEKDAATNSPTYQAAAADISKPSQAYKQGRISREEFLARTSAIVQRAVNENPRFADEIRKHAQNVLGLNPTSAQVDLQMEDQKAAKVLVDKGRETHYSYAVAHGIVYVNPDGSPDVDKTVRAGRELIAADEKRKNDVEAIDYQIKKGQLAAQDAAAQMATVTLENARLEGDLKRAELTKAKAAPTLTAEQAEAARGAAHANYTDQVFGEHFKSWGENFPSWLEKIQATGAKGPELDRQVTAALNSSKAIFMSKMNQTYTGLNVSTRQSLQTYAESLWKPYEEALAGGTSVLAARLRQAQVLEKNAVIGAHESLPTAMFLHDALGMATDPFINLGLSTNTDLAQRLTSEVAGWSNPASGQPKARDTAQAVGNLATGANPRALAQQPNNNGKSAVILGAITSLKHYEAAPNNLGPTELRAWGNLTQGLITEAISNPSPDTAQRASAWAQSPAALRIFDRYAADPNFDAGTVGRGMLQINSDNLRLNIPLLREGSAVLSGPATVRKMLEQNDRGVGGSTNVTYNAYYNPESGHIEITGKGLTERDNQFNLSTGQTGTPSSVSDANLSKAIPKEFRDRVQSMNRSLDAMVHVQEFGGDNVKALKPEQFKFFVATGFGLEQKPGTSKPQMPGDEAKSQTIKFRKAGTIPTYESDAAIEAKGGGGLVTAGNLDRSGAKEWSTIGVAEDGLNLTIVVPGTGSPEKLLEQYKKTHQSYGKFESGNAATAYMNGK